MFPIDNYELVYGRWEDHVIWDSDAVATVPPPSLPRIDPNDPNFILGLPDEPNPPPSAEKDIKKVKKVYLCITHQLYCIATFFESL